MYLVVGLGNPGSKYAETRHNAGFEACDLLASRASADAFREKFSGLTARGRFGAEEVVFLKPTTFMNLSGQSVQPAAAFLKVPVERVIVVYDEIDLPFGEVRIKKGGGHGGHNGIRSLLERLGSPEFLRVRIGIGRPPAGFRGDVADYVLMRFDADEKPVLGDLFGKAAEAAEDIIRNGFLEAMNRRNGKAPAARSAKPKPPKDPIKAAAARAAAEQAALEKAGKRPGGQPAAPPSVDAPKGSFRDE
jgi:peptidyl-tRNA hydrolase, PTH1 family